MLKNSDQLLLSVIEGIQEKKGVDISILDLKKIPNSVTDFFVICTGNSDTHIDAVSHSVEQTVKEKIGDRPWQQEGKTNREWILLDYSSVVVHVFKKEARERYNLEGLWGDAKITQIKEEETIG